MCSIIHHHLVTIIVRHESLILQRLRQVFWRAIVFMRDASGCLFMPSLSSFYCRIASHHTCLIFLLRYIAMPYSRPFINYCHHHLVAFISSSSTPFTRQRHWSSFTLHYLVIAEMRYIVISFFEHELIFQRAFNTLPHIIHHGHAAPLFAIFIMPPSYWRYLSSLRLYFVCQWLCPVADHIHSAVFRRH